MNPQEYTKNHYYEALSRISRLYPNLPVLATLQRGPNDYNIQKLAYLFEKYSLAIETNAAASAAPDPSAQLEPTPEPQEIKFESLPAFAKDELTRISNARKNLFKRGSFLHANQLESEKLTDEERKNLAFEILSIYDEQIPALDAQEAYILKHGMAPSPEAPANSKPAIDTSNPLEVYKRISTLKKNISRDKAKHPDRAEKYRTELKYLEQFNGSK